MKRWFQIFMCLLATLHLVGGHWGLLQMWAWGQMLRDYSRDKGIVLAVKDTFDGEHPCRMCLKIKDGKQQEEKEKTLPQSKQDKPATTWLALLPTGELPLLIWKDHSNIQGVAYRQIAAEPWRIAPPTPPPRCGVSVAVA